MKFYSHPNKLLIDHLKNVYDISINYVGYEYSDVLKVLCMCHDFGKYTTYFQDYLFKNKNVDRNLSNHGFISALFAAHTAYSKFGEGQYLPLICYSIVLHHHGSIENISDDLPSSIRVIDEDNDSPVLLKKIESAKIQMDDISKNKCSILDDYESVGYGGYFKSFMDCDICELLKGLKKLQLRFEMQKDRDERAYFIHQALYSALISSDKIDASNLNLPEERYIDFNTLIEIKDQKLSSKTGFVNDIRNEIFKIVQQNIVKNFNEKVFSITAPTGTGKTYTGFFAALKLAELIGGNRKIIYTLPFTSIIDQNYTSICELLEQIKDFDKNSSQYILMHHNLSNIDYKTLEAEYKRTEAELLIENWNSGIIVTTFVQLLETLIGCRNRMLKKFHNFRDAIILIDEVQSIDVSYLKLVDFILRSAVKYLNCKIILMTATKPLVLDDATELLSKSRYYFEKMQRTKLIPVFKKMDINSFSDMFMKNIEDKSYLIICNTINESLRLYDNIKSLGREIYYLSTNLLPVHRKDKIDKIKKALENGRKIILISTQVVEAGVDLDFDVVIRDIAPLDSIIQSAGRCNRNFKNKICGDVYIVSLVNEKGDYYAKHVYGTTLINLTMDLLKDKQSIHESDYYDLINEYYTCVNKLKNCDASYKLIDSVKALRFSNEDGENSYPIGKFSLIKNNPDYLDVYFRVDDEAERIYQSFIKILSEKDYNKKRSAYLEIKNKFRGYTLSIPQKYYKKFASDEFNHTGLLNLPYEGCIDYYSMETGFIRDEKEDFSFF